MDPVDKKEKNMPWYLWIIVIPFVPIGIWLLLQIAVGYALIWIVIFIFIGDVLPYGNEIRCDLCVQAVRHVLEVY
jgi:hypothetical protein